MFLILKDKENLRSLQYHYEGLNQLYLPMTFGTKEEYMKHSDRATCKHI